MEIADAYEHASLEARKKFKAALELAGIAPIIEDRPPHFGTDGDSHLGGQIGRASCRERVSSPV